jgi:hypothetical protein
MGRPSKFTASLAAAICWRLSQGELIYDIALDPEMPHRTTIHRWTEERPDFRQQFDLARQRQAHFLAEQALMIADDASGDVVGDQINHANVNRSRLRIDARRWLAGKLLPAVYGDKMLHTGADGHGPVDVRLSMDYGSLDAEELLVLRQLLEKATIRRAPALVEGEASEVDGDE